MSSVDVRANVAESMQFFDEILDMIPASYYYPDKQQELSHKFMFNKNGEQNTGVKQKRKSKSKKAARPNASSQELQIKFDPSRTTTITEVQEESAKVAESSTTMAATKQVFSGKATESIDALREKLRQKLQNMKPQRKEEVPEHLKKQKRKRDKEDRKEREQRSDIVKDQFVKKTKVTKAEKSTKKKSSKKESDDVEMDIVYGQIETTDDSGKVAFTKKKVDKKKLLKKAEIFEEKLKSMDETEAEKLRTGKAVKTALLRAQGIKVLDDKTLLKKALKREEKKRQKSTAQWRDRKKTVDDALKVKIDRRTENLQKRVDDKKARKIAKRKKKSEY